MFLEILGVVGGAILVADVLEIVSSSNKATAIKRARTDAVRSLIVAHSLTPKIRRQLRKWAVRGPSLPVFSNGTVA